MAILRCALGFSRLATLRHNHPSPGYLRGLASLKQPTSLFAPLDTFPERHIGPDDAEASKMLALLGYETMEAFVADTVPPKVRLDSHDIDNASIPAYSESQLNLRAKGLAGQNKPFKSYIGMGYHNAVVPPVILRNVRPGDRSQIGAGSLTQCLQVMENPAWYTQYTPYQPEIAQGIRTVTPSSQYIDNCFRSS